MLAQTMILGLALLLCLVSLVIIFGIRAGQASSITETMRRRLLAISFLGLVILLFLVIWFLVRNGFAWKPDLIALLLELVLTASAFVITILLPGSAKDEASSMLSQKVRRALLSVLFLSAVCLTYLLVRVPDQLGDAPTRALGLTLLILLAVLSVGGLIYFFVKEKPDALANDGDPMPIITRRVLAFYLLLLVVCLLFGLWRIATLDFPHGGVKLEIVSRSEAPAATSPAPIPSSPTGAPDPSGAASTTPGAGAAGANAPSPPPKPVLRDVISQVSNTGVPAVYLTAIGDNFTRDSRIRINQQPQHATIFIDEQRLLAQLDQSTIDGPSPFEVDVINNGKALSKSIWLTASKAEAIEKLTGWRFSRDLQLLLLALLAGALGSSIHALKSFGDFTGNRTIMASWYWWYMTRPFLGAALALVFYAVLRGGFDVGTPSEAKIGSPFGVIAIAALVGMFADKASDKLAEIFDVIFKSTDNRSGKLAAPIIDKLVPDTVNRGSPAIRLTIIGDRLGTVSKVRLDKEERQAVDKSERHVTVALTPVDLATPRTIKISVAGDNGESATKDFVIT